LELPVTRPAAVKHLSAPNILLIMTDQQSADTTSHELGPGRVHTPAMDRLAASGLRFDRAYCAHPLCVPSRTSMFSGRYPHETDTLTNDDLGRDLAAFPCVGALLSRAGYDTGYVGKWHLPYPDGDAAHGFRFRANLMCNGADIRNPDCASEFLRQRRQSPFFLVVSYNNPHNICEWARGARGSLPDGDIGCPPSGPLCPPRANSRPQRGEPDVISLLRRSYHASRMFPVGTFNERDWQEYQWAYYRMIECVDGHIARLLDVLESTGLKDNTAVIFVSDHGDAQGAHAWNQKTVLDDESARVPCIVSFPGRLAPGVSHALVQTGVDLAPTLCDLAGIPTPCALPGRSLLQLADGGRAEGGRPYIVTQTRFVQGAASEGVIPRVDGRMVRSQHYKYCVYDQGIQRESLVDMQADPGETVNLAGESSHRAVLETHRGYFEAFSRQFHDPFPGVASAVGRGT
jgi:arylsulfatase A-like enzyme